jgi:glycosyltransferase involved in cell wall biosynthesis
MDKSKLLSLVVPAYKQEKTIIKDVESLDKVLSSSPFRYEIIVVVDGFLDKTYDLLKNLRSKIQNLKVMGYEKNYGKGYAIKYGVSKAQGDIIGFIDAGMDLDPSEISVALDLMEWNKADIIVGSKLHPESKVNYPLTRKILSWGYRNLTHLLFGFNVKDTQVGFKLFKKKVAKDVFSKIIIKRFAFDVEVLTVAYALGYKKIYEAPIRLNFKGVSSITSLNFWSVIYSMLWDTAAVFYRLKILHYYDKKSSVK